MMPRRAYRAPADRAWASPRFVQRDIDVALRQGPCGFQSVSPWRKYQNGTGAIAGSHSSCQAQAFLASSSVAPHGRASIRFSARRSSPATRLSRAAAPELDIEQRRIRDRERPTELSLPSSALSNAAMPFSAISLPRAFTAPHRTWWREIRGRKRRVETLHVDGATK